MFFITGENLYLPNNDFFLWQRFNKGEFY